MNPRIRELCDKAELNKPNSEFKPEMYTSFAWMRALGSARVSAASDLGISDRTLERWENKVNKNLEFEEFAELVKLAVGYEFDQRFGTE